MDMYLYERDYRTFEHADNDEDTCLEDRNKTMCLKGDTSERRLDICEEDGVHVLSADGDRCEPEYTNRTGEFTPCYYETVKDEPLSMEVFPPADKAKLCHSRSKRKKKRLYVDLTNCRYDSVKRVLRRFGFRQAEDEEDSNLIWTDLSVTLERVLPMKAWQKINHYPGMSEICRKDSLARSLGRMAKHFPKEYNISPKTWCLPSEWNELQNYSRRHRTCTYILKPDTGCQGKGIIVTKSVKDIRPLENMICQVYLSKPFLIDGFKFDIRLYVLLTSCDPLRLYVFKDGLVRFATVRYAEPTQRNLQNVYMHLTNYAVQKHSDNYIRDDEQGGTKRRVTTLNRWFVDHGFDLKKIWNDVDDVIIKTILSGYAILQHNYRTCFPNHVQNSACFEILGFDIMFNANLKPFVLEVNHSPSFTTDSQLDKEIKETLLWDTLQLGHFSVFSKRRCQEEERRRIRNRLLQKKNHSYIRTSNEKEMARYQLITERYEENHMGNFRKIFPCKDSIRYDKYMKPRESFYQETTAYKVRSECSRQFREELRLKQEKLNLILHRNRPTSGESSSQVNHKPKPAQRSVGKGFATKTIMKKSTRQGLSTNPNGTPQLLQLALHPSSAEPQHYSNGTLVSAPVNWKPVPIVREAEALRLRTLKTREELMRSSGLITAVYQALRNSPGVAPSLQMYRRSKLKYLTNGVEGEDEYARKETGDFPNRVKENGTIVLRRRQIEEVDAISPADLKMRCNSVENLSRKNAAGGSQNDGPHKLSTVNMDSMFSLEMGAMNSSSQSALVSLLNEERWSHIPRHNAPTLAPVFNVHFNESGRAMSSSLQLIGSLTGTLRSKVCSIKTLQFNSTCCEADSRSKPTAFNPNARFDLATPGYVPERRYSLQDMTDVPVQLPKLNAPAVASGQFERRSNRSLKRPKNTFKGYILQTGLTDHNRLSYPCKDVQLSAVGSLGLTTCRLNKLAKVEPGNR